MVWLADGGNSMKVCLAVFTQYRHVTDRMTDGQTEGHLATAQSALCIYHRAVK